MAREAQYYPIWFTTDFEALGALDGWGAKIVRMTVQILRKILRVFKAELNRLFEIDTCPVGVTRVLS